MIFKTLTQRHHRDSNRNDPGNVFSGHQTQNLSDRKFRNIFKSACGASEILWFYQKSWKNYEIHAKSLNFTWNSWILWLFTKSAESRKLHKPILRFFEIFFRIDFVFGVQKTHFRGRCDRYRDNGVALRFWKSWKSWNFKGTSVTQSQWFGYPRVLLHRWATVGFSSAASALHASRSGTDYYNNHGWPIFGNHDRAINQCHSLQIEARRVAGQRWCKKTAPHWSVNASSNSLRKLGAAWALSGRLWLLSWLTDFCCTVPCYYAVITAFQRQ